MNNKVEFIISLYEFLFSIPITDSRLYEYVRIHGIKKMCSEIKPNYETSILEKSKLYKKYTKHDYDYVNILPLKQTSGSSSVHVISSSNINLRPLMKRDLTDIDSEYEKYNFGLIVNLNDDSYMNSEIVNVDGDKYIVNFIISHVYDSFLKTFELKYETTNIHDISIYLKCEKDFKYNNQKQIEELLNERININEIFKYIFMNYYNETHKEKDNLIAYYKNKCSYLSNQINELILKLSEYSYSNFQ